MYAAKGLLDGPERNEYAINLLATFKPKNHWWNKFYLKIVIINEFTFYICKMKKDLQYH